MRSYNTGYKEVTSSRSIDSKSQWNHWLVGDSVDELTNVLNSILFHLKTCLLCILLNDAMYK